MKRILIAAITLLCVQMATAQTEELYENALMTLAAHKLKKIPNLSDYTLEGHSFFMAKKNDSLKEEVFLSFGPENKITLRKITRDLKKETDEQLLYTGDVVRRENALSVRADQLNGQPIALPVVHNFLLTKYKKYYYLLDIATMEKWVDSSFLKGR